GIPEKDIDNIFSRYFQADNHRTSVDEGTGIGLSLTHELVKLLGGGITVESELNKGTVFTITLPLTTDAEEIIIPLEISDDQRAVTDLQETDRTGFESINKHDNRLKVLVVEDNKDVVRYIKGLLSTHYDLEVAFDGKLGLEKAMKSIQEVEIWEG
ncbi:MAG: ATP-binding protein, partial [Hyphomonas sp.]|nr:ATP-binding protein [Hyphomonas sp.]